MLSAESAKALIVDELNFAEDTSLAERVDQYWDMNSSETSFILQFLKTRRNALTYLQGKLRRQITVSLGRDKFANNELFKNISDMLEENDKQIASEIKYPAGSTSFGLLTPTTGLPDSIRYTEDLVRRYGLSSSYLASDQTTGVKGQYGS